jgi:hypothetical protein
MTGEPITAPIFDALVRKPERLWGAKAIARVIGCSVDTVASLARRPETPIYQPGGRYYALRSELERWLKTKPTEREERMMLGTRIPVRAVKAFADAGYSPEQIHREYPVLSLAAIEAVLESVQHVGQPD